GLEITNCHFQDNYSDFTGGALEVSGGTTARIINCSFIDNTARVNGGGARIVDNPSVIEGNIFLQNSATDTISPGNTTGNGGALYLSYAHDGMTLISNIMENNRSNSSLYESTRYSLITNNLITNNAGIGLVCGHTGSVSRYVNNTICSNEDGGFAMGSATAWIGNNIIAYNGIGGASAQMLIYADTPVVYHSCIPGGYIPQYSQGVMDADPLFINPSNHPGLLDTSLKHDWRLQLGSPCLDAGTLMVPGGVLPASDLTGAPRISGQGIDMGAYEHQVNGVINSTSPDPGTTIVPNPAQYNIRVRSGEEFTKGKLSMTDLTGISVLDRSFSPGEYIDIGHLRPGVYVCRILTSSGNTSCQKLIKY
ncbi:MAG: T9SS type A sorting domain-containing protein, partial [Bacteroidales bacterium]|nr:T9SS type A sorting domain-containing protein [Bacteroidales bacterium]